MGGRQGASTNGQVASAKVDRTTVLSRNADRVRECRIMLDCRTHGICPWNSVELQVLFDAYPSRTWDETSIDIVEFTHKMRSGMVKSRLPRWDRDNA